MCREGFEEEQVRLFRKKILKVERERLDGAKTISVSEVREKIRERIEVLYESEHGCRQ